eukprot:UN12556
MTGESHKCLNFDDDKFYNFIYMFICQGFQTVGVWVTSNTSSTRVISCFPLLPLPRSSNSARPVKKVHDVVV